ncbi:MAG TPA: DUF4920 domain-containing protein [Polyangiaceae bacterium]|jgi:hypothetical protein|nr:DUF4920 domain-containing protein [Polyangiaceae bacterium]
MRSSSVILVALVLSTACHSASSEPAPAKVAPAESVAQAEAPVTPPPGAAAAMPPSGALKRFGEPIAPGATVTLANVLAKPDEFANHTVTLEAKVRRNCTRRGCWMELSQAMDPALPGCRVTFKDYGFFVPLDSAGSTARVQGTVEVTHVAPGEVAHLESEGAQFAAKQPDGTASEVRLVATGVELWREQT